MNHTFPQLYACASKTPPVVKGLSLSGARALVKDLRQRE